MGKPAARIDDMHTCPMKENRRAHEGGPILEGSPDVFIGGMPAARVGDKAMCNGSPDTIIQGEPSVLINNKPAARMGDKTAHGGVIVGGCGTVLIGANPGRVLLVTPPCKCMLSAAKSASMFVEYEK